MILARDRLRLAFGLIAAINCAILVSCLTLACGDHLSLEQQEARSILRDRGTPFEIVSFLAAADHGDLDTVLLFIRAGMDVDANEFAAAAREANRRRPFFFARQSEVGKFFYGRSALSVAVVRGHKEIVIHLLALGANPNKRDVYDNTPLYIACRRGDTEIVQQLLKDGARVNDPVMGGTALSESLFDPSPKKGVIRLLLQEGATTSVKGDSGQVAVFFARLRGDSETIEWVNNAVHKEFGAIPSVGDSVPWSGP